MPQRKALFNESTTTIGGRAARRKSDSELDITPMIDVTFLLLIFFMVTSTMQTDTDLNVPTARHGLGINSSEVIVVTVKRPTAGGDRPVIILGDGKGPQGTLDDVREYVEEGLRQNRTEVIIKADRNLLHGTVQEVTRVVASIEGVKFYIGVEDKPVR